MAKKLYLLDGMSLVYRSHFAFLNRPILTSAGINTSALYGFTQSLLEILRVQQPTHIAVAFDTSAPTQRHVEYAEYKVQRETMPEDLSQALPHVYRMLSALNVSILSCDGYEADDVIGTLVSKAEKESFESYMVTLDKDFAQLVTEKTFLYKLSRMGDAVEILGRPEVLKKWGVQRPDQIIDILGLWGDPSDNIPGVPGIGEKTAGKLIAQYGSIENLLTHTAELKGKLKETLEAHREQALLSKRLATINCRAPCDVDLDQLEVQKPNDPQLKGILIEFEFNSIGRRLFGEDFRTARVQTVPAERVPAAEEAVAAAEAEQRFEKPPLKTIAEAPHDYRFIRSAIERAALVDQLRKQTAFGFCTHTTGSDPKRAHLRGLSFCTTPHCGYYVCLPADMGEAAAVLDEFRSVLQDPQIEKVGHHLKFDASVLKWHGLEMGGKLFDVILAHSLIEPDMRHTLEYLSENCLGYSPLPLSDQEGLALDLGNAGMQPMAQAAVERADIAWQLRSMLEPLLKQKGQERVFYQIEAPLIPVLVDMEFEGIEIDAVALAEFGKQLTKEMAECEKTIHILAGREFNLNSPRQLGEILFDVLKLADNPKKTRTGQYATNEQTLLALAADHEIVRRLLDYRMASKLKSTYIDALPAAIWEKTGRVHTTYNQAVTATGRLQSENPNLQNIPVRTERGKEIRKAFVPRSEEWLLLSADYSQVELRIIAALSREAGMLEAFQKGIDIHTATAAGVYRVPLDLVTFEMRRKAKMVNYGIAYGISAFGLAQRLGIPRAEAAAIIENYFTQFAGVRHYMTGTVAFARNHGYVETITGRRRYIREIRSANATVRNAAERNAINAPIQGSAADMIKLAMVDIHRELKQRELKTRLLLQVHDELVFELYKPEHATILPLIKEKMTNAIHLDVPIVVEVGAGKNWLEAH